jgi:TFIIF-interacting CTD phosphatase-like protein
MNIILDLDSTVISSLIPSEVQPNNLISHKMENYFIVYERPGLQEFLDYLFGSFNVAVWTAASKDYALFIADKILLQNKNRKLDFILHDYHGHISEQRSSCPKDLNLIWKIFGPKYTAENTIIIDDYEEVFKYQMCNSYPIPPFNASDPDAYSDQELIKLQNKLKLISPGKCPNTELITTITLQKAVQKIEQGAFAN